jgi:hypothetical protein
MRGETVTPIVKKGVWKEKVPNVPFCDFTSDLLNALHLCLLEDEEARLAKGGASLVHSGRVVK